MTQETDHGMPVDHKCRAFNCPECTALNGGDYIYWLLRRVEQFRYVDMRRPARDVYKECIDFIRDGFARDGRDLFSDPNQGGV